MVHLTVVLSVPAATTFPSLTCLYLPDLVVVMRSHRLLLALSEAQQL